MIAMRFLRIFRSRKILLRFVDIEGEPIYHSSYSIKPNSVIIGDLDYSRAYAVVCFEKEGLYIFKLLPKNEYSDYGDD